MSNTEPAAEPHTTQTTRARLIDAESRAHEHMKENAGPSWTTLDKEQLRRLVARGYRPGAQPGQSYRPQKQAAKPVG